MGSSVRLLTIFSYLSPHLHLLLTDIYLLRPRHHSDHSNLRAPRCEQTASAKATRLGQVLVFRFGELEYSRPGHSYVSLGIALTAFRMGPNVAFHLTQRYFTVDCAKRKAASAVAHLCLMPSTYGGVPRRGRNGCKIYLGQSYNVSTPCSLSQQFSGLGVP